MIKLIDIYNEHGNDAYIWKEDAWMPLTEGYCKGFDIDLKFGKMGEEFTQNVFEGNSKVEVKTERDIWSNTGNICIEIESRGKPSGLATTEAELWVQNLVKDGELVCSLVFKTDKLKEIVEKMPTRIVMGGDNFSSKLHLVSLKDLMEELSK